MKYLEYAQAFGATDEVKYWISHNLSNYLKENPEVQDDIEHIIDYLVSDDAPKRLKSMSYDEAKSNAEKWTKAQQKKGQHIKEADDDTEVVLDFKDGFKVVRLVGENAYKREGYLMRHCIASYYGSNTEIYSLRDKDNNPHCTMEKDQQIKGKGNGDIHPKYIGYVVKFLEHIDMTVGDNEMKHLGYANMEKFKKELHKDTQYFNKKYLPITEVSKGLKGKDGKPFASLDLLDVIPLVEDNGYGLKINFELPTFIKLSFEYIQSKSKILAKGNASSGDYATNEMEGLYSVSVDAGHEGKAKGKIGCWFCLSEWTRDEDGIWKPICVKAVQIDGKKIKEDTWYTLKGGKFNQPAPKPRNRLSI